MVMAERRDRKRERNGKGYEALVRAIKSSFLWRVHCVVGQLGL